MGDKSVTVEGLFLYDNWPGVAVPPPFPVTDMTSASVGYNLVHPMWDVGTKWELYCYGNQASVGVSYRQGFSTFIYLKGSGHMSGGAPDAARTEGTVPASTIVAATCTNMALHTVQVDTGQTTHEQSGLFAMCIGAVTNAYYAWFWCGGVYPVEYIASGAVADTFETNDSVTASSELGGVALATTIPGFAINAAASQIPGIGISLLID
jgi:hypothetical protein